MEIYNDVIWSLRRGVMVSNLFSLHQLLPSSEFDPHQVFILSACTTSKLYFHYNDVILNDSAIFKYGNGTTNIYFLFSLKRYTIEICQTCWCTNEIMFRIQNFVTSYNPPQKKTDVRWNILFYDPICDKVFSLFLMSFPFHSHVHICSFITWELSWLFWKR